MKIKKGLKIREVAGEKILVVQGDTNVDLTKVVSFNSTAEWIWNEFSGKDFTLAELVKSLVENFEVDEQTATADAQKFVDSLVVANLVEE